MRLRFAIIALLCCAVCAVKAQNGGQSLEIDASSFCPVQTDALSGVAIDPIGLDRSKRPCARIKMHVNRMTRDEIENLVVQPVGGNVVLMKRIVAAEGTGLIFEMTAKQPTRFYLHHDKYGDSNEVSLNLEGNKEYRLEAQLNMLLSVVVSSNIKDAEVFVDNEFKGRTGEDFMLTVQDVTPGAHKIAVVYGAARNEQTVDVNSNNISFRITLDTAVSRPQFVIFEVEPKTAMVIIDEKPYTAKDGFVQALLQNGTYVYNVMAQGYHAQQDTLIVSGAKLMRKVVLKPDVVTVTISSTLGSDIWVNNELKGPSPWTGKLTAGVYIFEARRVGHQPTVLSQEVTSEPAYQSYTLDAPTPITGALCVTSSPMMADVVVDGVRVGQTPLTASILAGEHKIIICKRGYKTIEHSVVAEMDKNVELNCELSPAEDFFTPGKSSYDAKDYVSAVNYFRQGAEQGDAYSEYWLGLCFYLGRGVELDYNNAASYFVRSAEKGYVEAQSRLAQCYFAGHGVDKNYKEAARYFYRAAMQGHTSSQKRLAKCYEMGIGVPRNTSAAIYWNNVAMGLAALPKRGAVINDKETSEKETSEKEASEKETSESAATPQTDTTNN